LAYISNGPALVGTLHAGHSKLRTCKEDQNR
jgi:hypothetical protein